jgi:hypothetical protein
MADQSVKTAFGEFIPKYYEPVHNMWHKSIGVNMYLEFKPGDRVIDATKIGFVQTVRNTDKGEPIANTENEYFEKMVNRGVGEGYYIDQKDKLKNPLYATGTVKDASVADPDEKLEGYEDDKITEVNYKKKNKEFRDQTEWGRVIDRKYAGFGEFGYRYARDKSVPADANTPQLNPKTFEEKNSSFQDCPHDFKRHEKSGQEFETTAVVTDGKQKGLYLGSMNWGWERTDKSDASFKKLPFELKSEGAPSEVFFKSADRWNQAKTEYGKETVNLPMSEGTVLKDQLKFYKKTKVADIDPTQADKKLAKGTHLRMIKEEGNYLYIRILDANETFEEGFVPNAENGKATIDDSKTFLNWPK